MKVREILRLLEDDGWYLVSTRGSHRQYQHVWKMGRVTVAGKLSDDLAIGTLRSILKHTIHTGPMMRYAVIIEKGKRNFSAYVPDVPGCVATGKTRKAVQRHLREALASHLEGMREDGIAIPKPTSIAEYIELSR
jgi:predicted RNA binding protein YcfA (HicA-like mRNA interferase family)/predicted RNase H-like HicB family nuclease